MNFNKLAPLSLFAALAMAGCKEDQTVNDTRAKVQTSVKPTTSAEPVSSSYFAPLEPTGYCPSDMVKVPGCCIDRYEISLYGTKEGYRADPNYYPNYPRIKDRYEFFTKGDENSDAGPPITQIEMLVPKPRSWQLDGRFKVKAMPIGNQIPNAYISGVVAENVCKNAGKRLCTEEEWVTACKGENNTKFPYGDEYEEGVCNISRIGPPMITLHGESVEHLDDPRLNLVEDGKGNPLLEKTGNRPKCVSTWGGDAVYDMVGNLQEWIDDKEGTFSGGAHVSPSRTSRKGCYIAERLHSTKYHDYSLTARCCSDIFSKPQPFKELPVAESGTKQVGPKIVCSPKDVVLSGVDVVPREEWAPLPANLGILGNMDKCNNYPIQKITLHHTGDGVITKPGEGRKRAGGSVFFHVNSKQDKGLGWGDIAYHYLVTPNGEILEGRDAGFRVDSLANYRPGQDHSHNLVVALVGNYEKEEQELTTEARQSVISLLGASLKHYGLSADDIIFHKDIAYTPCPGQQLTDWFNKQGKSELAGQPILLPKTTTTGLPSSVPHQLLPDSPYPQQ